MKSREEKMSGIFANRVTDCPVTFEDMSIVEPKQSGFKEYCQSPTFRQAVKIEGRSLGELEQLVSDTKMHLQDPESRTKGEQISHKLSGKAGEVAFAYLCDVLGLPVEYLADNSHGYACDALLMTDNCAKYPIEIKTAQMSSAGQNLSVPARYDEDTVEEAMTKEDIVPSAFVLAYFAYTGGSIVVGFEGVEQTNPESNGLLYREPREMYEGDLYLYDRKCIRSPLKALREDTFWEQLDREVE